MRSPGLISPSVYNHLDATLERIGSTVALYQDRPKKETVFAPSEQKTTKTAHLHSRAHRLFCPSLAFTTRPLGNALLESWRKSPFTCAFSWKCVVVDMQRDTLPVLERGLQLQRSWGPQVVWPLTNNRPETEVTAEGK